MSSLLCSLVAFFDISADALYPMPEITESSSLAALCDIVAEEAPLRISFLDVMALSELHRISIKLRMLLSCANHLSIGFVVGASLPLNVVTVIPLLSLFEVEEADELHEIAWVRFCPFIFS